MKISVFGLGYVGSVTAACLADQGIDVIGLDVNAEKVDWINRGKPPVLEASLGELVERNVRCGRLRATTNNSTDVVAQTDVSMVCVGTPSLANGDLDLRYVKRVAEQLGEAIRSKRNYHTVVYRSTMLPGTTWDVIRPILEARSGKKAIKDFGLCFNPEFLREGTAIEDFYNPPYTILGVENDGDVNVLRNLYSWLDAEQIIVSTRVAESIKYVNNCYHALKVTFANEVGRFCRALGIDSHEVMDIFCKDNRQNLSASYLKPGFAFGGSCLPKDLRALLYHAKLLDVPMEVFSAILPSNETQVKLGIRLVEEAGNRKVGLLGLSFKAGTDDLRESPLVALAETLYGRGYEVRIYDDQVALARLIGANKMYLEERLPHIDAMLHDRAEAVIEGSDTIIIGNRIHAFGDILARIPPEKDVIDLVRITGELDRNGSSYQGIGW
jgi:GDP-mannose 6-dehydrogenase